MLLLCKTNRVLCSAYIPVLCAVTARCNCCAACSLCLVCCGLDQIGFLQGTTIPDCSCTSSRRRMNLLYVTKDGSRNDNLLL
uniref:Putative secreted protein n=1 Tax=Ixodes scapularis TaxID=6945 RepID=A0A4D5RZC5_IXOSC